jgi:hypothetical protein
VSMRCDWSLVTGQSGSSELRCAYANKREREFRRKCAFRKSASDTQNPPFDPGHCALVRREGRVEGPRQASIVIGTRDPCGDRIGVVLI